ncbi:hypothetical protein MUN82_19815 [Hymenobacter aerilatus]|uniref:Uncharacterized protein n=1 Tax=Hymenobacter aerilatus TaxID=2932251 RepID=A0A8T9SUW8_9BACT|nr:hypothetical protein [Hymenobacter aerilatus]UOR05171.1 hypothetical protein MUN82_19815 [Hymenobacter aerilatus]
MDSGLVFQLAFIIPIFYLLAGLVLFVLTVRVLLVLHTYLTLKVKQERMPLPSSLDE